jgi:hypothetical protein
MPDITTSLSVPSIVSAQRGSASRPLTEAERRNGLADVHREVNDIEARLAELEKATTLNASQRGRVLAELNDARQRSGLACRGRASAASSYVSGPMVGLLAAFQSSSDDQSLNTNVDTQRSKPASPWWPKSEEGQCSRSQDGSKP